MGMCNNQGDLNWPYFYSFLVEWDFCLLDFLHDNFKLIKEEPHVRKTQSHQRTTLRNNLIFMQIRKNFVMCAFFLCSFCRSLNCSILFTSSFSNPESWMCKCPTFSISEKHQNTQLEVQLRHDASEKSRAGNKIRAYALSFHQKMISASCEDKTATGQINELKSFLSVWFCRVNVLTCKVASVPKCVRAHTHTHSPTRSHIHPQPCGQLWPVPCHTSPLLMPCNKTTTEVRHFAMRS